MVSIIGATVVVVGGAGAGVVSSSSRRVGFGPPIIIRITDDK